MVKKRNFDAPRTTTDPSIDRQNNKTVMTNGSGRFLLGIIKYTSGTIITLCYLTEIIPSVLGASEWRLMRKIAFRERWRCLITTRNRFEPRVKNRICQRRFCYVRFSAGPRLNNTSEAAKTVLPGLRSVRRWHGYTNEKIAWKKKTIIYRFDMNNFA